MFKQQKGWPVSSDRIFAHYGRSFKMRFKIDSIWMDPINQATAIHECPA